MIVDTGLCTVPWRGLVAILRVQAADVAPRGGAPGAVHVSAGIVLTTGQAAAGALHLTAVFDSILNHFLGRA